jgi:hypothetical protein
MTLWTQQDTTTQLKNLSEHLLVLQHFEEIVQREGFLTEDQQKEVIMRTYVSLDIRLKGQHYPLTTHSDGTITSPIWTKKQLLKFVDQSVIKDILNSFYTETMPTAHKTVAHTNQSIVMVEVRSVRSLGEGMNAPTGVGISSNAVLAECLAMTRLMINVHTIIHLKGFKGLKDFKFSALENEELVKSLSKTGVTYQKDIKEFIIPPEEVKVPDDFIKFVKFFTPKASDAKVKQAYTVFLKGTSPKSNVTVEWIKSTKSAVTGKNPTKYIYDDATMEPSTLEAFKTVTNNEHKNGCKVKSKQKYNSNVYDEKLFKTMYPDACHVVWDIYA